MAKMLPVQFVKPSMDYSNLNTCAKDVCAPSAMTASELSNTKS